MDAHTGAIASYLIPLLLAVLCGLASYGLYMHKSFMNRNEDEHKRLQEQEASHETRITRCETKIENFETSLRETRLSQGGRP